MLLLLREIHLFVDSLRGAATRFEELVGAELELIEAETPDELALPSALEA